MTEFSKQPDEFTEQFNAAISSVERFNQGYEDLNSETGRMMGMLLGPIGPEDRQPAVSREEQAAMEKELVTVLQADDLEAMGIRLFDTARNQFNPNSPSVPGKLIPVLDDGEKFSETIRRLNPKDEKQKNTTDYSVNKILETTARIIWEANMLTFADEHEERAAQYTAERQIEMFRDVQPALADNGFSEVQAAKTLANYLARYDEGTLRPYLKAKSLSLIESTNGPAEWNIDNTGQSLADQWNRVFDFLTELKRTNSPMYRELFAKVRRDYDTMREKILQTDKNAHFHWDVRQKLDRIGERWKMDFQDDNTLYLMERAEIDGYEPTAYDREADTEPPKPAPRVYSDDEKWWKD